MKSPLADLESILQQLIIEHRQLLLLLESQQAAMKKLNTPMLEDMAAKQEQIRLKIASLETRRRTMVAQLCLSLKIQGPPTMAKLAEHFPSDKKRLLDLRDKLKMLVAAISSRATVSGRLAGAVLGHLNTVVRLLSGAVEQAGLYTKHGVPQVSRRIGMMEAVG
jgi:hypothetical protein